MVTIAEPARLDDFLFGGEAIDELLPSSWRIAVTEMATFAFMNDREIVDLWGYTSPTIANSAICSEALLRNDPGLFLEEAPEVLWARTEVSGKLYAIPSTMNYEALASQWMFSKWINLLGDMHEVMAIYDIVKLHHFEQRYSLLLVRRDLLPALEQMLTANGFGQTMTRPFEWETFSMLYGNAAPVQYDCS